MLVYQRVHGFLYFGWLAGFLPSTVPHVTILWKSCKQAWRNPRPRCLSLPHDFSRAGTWTTGSGKKVPQNYMGSAWDAVLDPRQADVRNGKKFFPVTKWSSNTHLVGVELWRGSIFWANCFSECFSSLGLHSGILDCRWGIFLHLQQNCCWQDVGFVQHLVSSLVFQSYHCE